MRDFILNEKLEYKTYCEHLLVRPKYVIFVHKHCIVKPAYSEKYSILYRFNYDTGEYQSKTYDDRSTLFAMFTPFTVYPVRMVYLFEGEDSKISEILGREAHVAFMECLLNDDQ